jgi:hypothetical protein
MVRALLYQFIEVKYMFKTLKYITVLFPIFTSIAIANPQDNSNPLSGMKWISSREYIGQVEVNGPMTLDSSNGEVDLNSGPVKFTFTKDNYKTVLRNPLNFIRPLWELKVEDQDNTYFFRVPRELVSNKLDTILVPQNKTGQDMSLLFTRNAQFESSHQEERIAPCEYSGGVMSCNAGMCTLQTQHHIQGKQRALQEIKIYRVNIDIKIFNESTSSHIRTEDFTDEIATTLKELSECGE